MRGYGDASRATIGAMCAAVAALAACAGDENTYTLRGSQACLAQLGEVVDLGRGSVRVGRASNPAWFLVYLNESDAKTTEAAYDEQSAHPSRDNVKRERNVVLVFERTPTDAELDSIVGCLDE